MRRSEVETLRRRYGDGPLHLIAVVISFAIVAYALIEIAQRSGVLSFAIFFAGAIVAHDLISFPVYSLFDRIAGRASATVGLGPTTVNFVRIPALLSGFALIVWFPLILGLDDRLYVADTGHQRPPYLERWLLLTAALFAVSGIVYALRRRSRARDLATDPPGPRIRR
jgi:hypothetical protein